jgi:hypothetical protein
MLAKVMSMDDPRVTFADCFVNGQPVVEEPLQPKAEESEEEEANTED